MASNSEADDGFVRVATLQELRSKRRLRVQVKDRVLALFCVRGTMFALDHFCYHTGGPLALGDIEDYDGRPCVICPWHKHKITLDTGESLYTAIDPKNPRNIKPNCSKGRRQRVHQIREDGEYVVVKISDPSQDQQELESDRYYTEPYRVFIENSLKEDGKHPNAVKVPIHSSRTGLAGRGKDLHYTKR